MISIIVPVHNGELFIDAFVSSYEHLVDRHSIPHELLLIDNHSADRSLEMLLTHQDSFESILIFSYKLKQDSYATRNYAVRKAKGNMLAFTDIDCLFERNWLKELHKIQSVEEIVAGDVVLFPKERNRYNAYEKFDALFSFNLTTYVKEKSGITANLVVPKNIYYQVGGFKEIGSGADRTFCKASSDLGNGFSFNESLKVFHPARSTFFEVRKKVVRVSIGKARLYSDLGIKQRITFTLLNFVGMFIQPNQWKVLLRNSINNISIRQNLLFIIQTFYFGFIARGIISYQLIKSLLIPRHLVK